MLDLIGADLHQPATGLRRAQAIRVRPKPQQRSWNAVTGDLQ